jgi:undecaprenyl-diphosphatase
MSILHAIVLGVTQGLSEFLPISSSGHLALVPWLFGWDDFDGNESLAKAFDVALHVGTLVGALAYFRGDFLKYARAGLAFLFPSNRSDGWAGASTDARIGWLLVASAVPAGITGVAFEGLIENLDDEIWLIAVMLIVFGFVLLWADRLGGDRKIEDFSLRDALTMGIGQALALQPGVSRSGVTITVSRWLGFRREAAARLSFLMSLPIIAGAGLYKALDVFGGDGVPADARGAFVAGMLSAGVTGYAAVWGTLRFVQTHTFTPFVIYRVVVGVSVLLILATTAR